jgi:DNA processing protein
MEIRERIAQYAYAYEGDWNQISRAIQKNLVLSSRQIKENYITFFDEAYPEQLRQLRYPPWILFYEGDLSLLKQPMMTIVGSRELNEYGKKNTEAAVSILKDSYVIVSGLAKGADACAHEAALKGGKTIGVIGCGLGRVYPACNRQLYQKIRQNGLILSEYPYFTGPQKYHFPWRNRILAALGEACIVTQAAVNSGTMLTVNEAISLSKDIWCFPYPFLEESGKGCNRLIEQGAGILYEEEQLLDFSPKKAFQRE